MLSKKFTATAIAALLVSTSANAQIFGDDYGTDLDVGTFQSGFTETGYYDAWDTDDDTYLSEPEFATGIYADWDRDGDLEITREEYEMGAERWFGPDYDTDAEFTTWDTDAGGFIDREEFGGAWDTGYYQTWDADEDELLTQEEFGTGLYNTVDVDQDRVITIEEEGWFEGWFDGDDVEAEIREVGEIM